MLSHCVVRRKCTITSATIISVSFMAAPPSQASQPLVWKKKKAAEEDEKKEKQQQQIKREKEKKHQQQQQQQQQQQRKELEEERLAINRFALHCQAQHIHLRRRINAITTITTSMTA